MKRLKWIVMAVMAAGMVACAPQPTPAPQTQVVSQPAFPATVPDAAPPLAPPPAPHLPGNIPTVKVGLLLPLSGSGQEIGEQMRDAAMLALHDRYAGLDQGQQTVRIALLPKDTASSPQVAAHVAQEAIQEGAELLIGPLFSREVSAVAPIANAQNIPVIALSNNRAVADNNIFVYGFLPDQQVYRIITHALLKGQNILGSIAPNDAYGMTVSQLVAQIMQRRQGTLAASELYGRSPANIQAAATRLSTAYRTQPFSALFIAEGGAELPMLLQTMQNAALPLQAIQLLGTGLWDSEDMQRIKALYGAKFATASPKHYHRFERRFEAVYRYSPKRLASLTYDAVSLVTGLALENSVQPFAPHRLINREGFVGPANGLYRFLPNGITERSLAVLKITDSGLEIVDAAPMNFK